MRRNVLPKGGTALKALASFFLLVSLATHSLSQIQVYYPLRSGNVWQYSEIPYCCEIARVTNDSVIIEGRRYSRIDGSFGMVLRQDGSKVYRRTGSRDDLVYDFSKTTPGDTVSVLIGSHDTTTITVQNYYLRDYWQRQLRTWTFFEQPRHSTGYAIWQVTDSLGLTGIQGEPGFALGLRGAIINGIQYGVIVNVAYNINRVPDNFALYQNYPNPFNPSTTISFELPISSFVNMEVFDVLGREVATVLQEQRDAGKHAVQFYASNMSSGVYFYHIQAGKHSAQRKMLLLR